ncbi:hypothetical protein T06_5961 [Trichinella sp. T6]|nr:hypothetical protein T06_5961 [Trichinella sp. T6]
MRICRDIAKNIARLYDFSGNYRVRNKFLAINIVELRGLQNTGDTPLFCRTCEWKVMCEDQCRTLSEELFTSHDRRDCWRS